nr:7TM GPCR domain containing protein [Haemonchus contortus]
MPDRCPPRPTKPSIPPGTESSFHATGDQCYFTKVVDYRYLVYVIFVGTILAPTLLIVFCYVSIYSRIRKEEHQIKCLLRKSERDRRMQGRRRLIKILLILVVSYGICWYPLYVINSIDYFLPEFSIAGLTLWTVVLSHMSCALNPLIYAYGMPGFKKALREFFNVSTFQSNTGANYSCYMKCSDAGKANQNQSDRIRRFPSETVRKISAPTPIIKRSLTEVYKLMRRRTIDIT